MVFGQDRQRPGDWARWLTKFAASRKWRDNDERTEWIRSQLTGTRCVVLDYAVHARSARKTPDFAPVKDPRLWDKLVSAGFTGSSLAALQARVGLLECFANPAATVDEQRQAIEQVIQKTKLLWSHSTAQEVKALLTQRVSKTSGKANQLHEPSFLACLGNEAIRNLFRLLAEEYSWAHPGLLLAGETLAAVAGDHGRVEAVADTSLLIATKVAGRDCGVIVPLRVERLSGGCGVLAPDPWSTAYLELDADFSKGLQHAWHAAMVSDPGVCNFDWRWSLDLRAATRHLPQRPVVYPLGGPSAEVAVACGLRAVDARRKDVPLAGELDIHTAVTARFKQPFDRQHDLAPVTGVDVKTLGFPFERRRVWQVVLAEGHSSDDLPPQQEGQRSAESPRDGEPGFVEARTLDKAFEALSRGPRITRAVKDSLRKRATALREQLCDVEPEDPERDGRRYVPSPLAELIDHDLPSQPKAPEDRWRPLSDDERQAFAEGRWRPAIRDQRDDVHSGDHEPEAPRIRLFADSGLGKTIQLLACEEQIAGLADGRVPIRLGKQLRGSINLSDINWQNLTGDVMQKIYELCLAAAIPPADQSAGLAWFQDVVARGDVVFLLDALDQSQDALLGFVQIFQSPLLAGCPLIVAGRPETINSRSAVWGGTEAWTTIQVQPFRRGEQQAFLGTALAPVLIPEGDKPPRSWASNYAAELQRHQWAELLGVPLLLRFLRELAVKRDANGQAELLTLRSRYAIYQAAVEQLIQKGLESLSHKTGDERRRVTKVLPLLALAAVRRHEFTGVVEGDAFDEAAIQVGSVYGSLYEELQQRLLQIDLVTAHGIFDPTGTHGGGLEFRHKSMLEFFAGCALADLFRDPATRPLALVILDDIHNVLAEDAAGNEVFRADLLDDAGETCRHLPREWSWTLRFALSHAPQGPIRDELAWQLILRGNPWVVFDAIEHDRLDLEPSLEDVCRWLVHRDYASRDYRGAWKERPPEPPVTAWVGCCRRFARTGKSQSDAAAIARIVTGGLLSRRFRDTAYLSPLKELLCATAIDPTVPPGIAVGCRQSWLVYLQEAAALSLPVVRDLLELKNFVPIPAGEFDPRPFHAKENLVRAGITGPITIPAGYRLADFPVTNEQFEGWCPAQRRWRGRDSRADDQPVVSVTWFIGVEYCAWLTGDNHRETFSLPTEWEWEYACRAGTTTDYWWGNRIDDRICWYGGTSNYKGTRSRTQTLAAEAEAQLRHPWGLHDMHGNVWEWSLSARDAELYGRRESGVTGSELDDIASSIAGIRRVLRGGSFHGHAGEGCSAGRDDGGLNVRSRNVGIRLSWRCRVESSA